MMLDGTLCSCCGELLISEGEEEAGYPVMCAACLADSKPEVSRPPAGKQFKCADCGKKFGTAQGIHDHRRMKHAAP